MGISVDGVADKALNTVSGKLVRDSATATGAPTATGVTALYTGNMPTVCHKVRVSGASAFTAAAATQVIDLWTLPPGFVLQRIVAEVVSVFAGTSITDVDCEVGRTGGDTDAFLKTFDLDTAAIIAGQVVAGIGVDLVDATRADVKVTTNEFAAETLHALFTAAGADIVNMTAGIVDFYIIGHQLPLT